MDVVTMGIGDILPYWRNPRKNAETVVELKLSIREFGFNVPLVLDQENVIIAGHARYRAMLELGEQTVPCVISDMDETRAKEFRIADNKIHDLTNWVVEGLLKELGSSEYALTVPGFTTGDMEVLFPDTAADGLGFTEDGLGGDGGSEGASTGGDPFEGGTEQPADTSAGSEGDEDRVELMCPSCLEEGVYSKTALLGTGEDDDESGE